MPAVSSQPVSNVKCLVCQSLTAASASQWLPTKVIICHRLRSWWQEKTAIVKKHSFPFISTGVFELPEILGAAGDLANVEGWTKKDGVWAKKEGVWAKDEKVAKNAFCWEKVNFRGQRNFSDLRSWSQNSTGCYQFSKWSATSAPRTPTILAPHSSAAPRPGIASSQCGWLYRPDSRCQLQSLICLMQMLDASCRPLSPAMRVAAIPLLSHAATARLVCCRFRGPTGWPLAVSSQLPHLIACAGAKAVLERQGWLKVMCGYQQQLSLSAMLMHTWALLTTCYSSGAELNN